jgi:hypothetical protein
MPTIRKCEKCGGDLQYNPKEHTYTCPYCGAVYEEDKQDVLIKINLNGQELEDAGAEGISVKITKPDAEQSPADQPSTIAGMTPEEIRTLPKEEVRRRLAEYRKTHPTSSGCGLFIFFAIFALVIGLIVFLSNLKCDTDTSKSTTTTVSVTVNGRETRLDQITQAEDFSEGLAAVSGSGGWGYFDTNGNMVIPLQFDEAGPFSEGMAAVRSGSRWGYINRDGLLVITYQFNDAESFSDGMAGVEIGSKWGYVDKTGKLVIPTRFYKTKKFSGGIGVVYDSKDYYQLVDKTGRVLRKFYVWEPDDPSEGLVGAGTSGDDSGYSYFDSTGRKVIANKEFNDVKAFHGGLAAVRTQKGWGFINKSGVFIIPPKYENVHDFSDGLAAVQTEREGDWAFIDGTGKVVLQLATSERVGDFSEGALAVYEQKSDTWGYIKKDGSWLIVPQFKQAEQFHDGWAMVRVGTSYQNYVNQAGKLMFPVYKRD